MNNKPTVGRPGLWLFLRLAVQNLGRCPTRTSLLAFAVALGSGAVFTTLVVARGIQASMDVSFARLGADLLVVPQETLVNITSALLTVEPTEHTFDASLADQVAALRGVSQVAPQRLYRVPVTSGAHVHEVGLIAFDPVRDFTVQPWLTQRLERPPGPGDVLVGGSQNGTIGEALSLGGQALTVYGRLQRTGVGPFDNALFITFETAELLAHAGALATGPGRSAHDPSRMSALLVRLGVGATPEQVRFAVAGLPGIKVAAGEASVTSSRQGVTALLGGVFAFTGLMLLGAVVLVSVLFSAILAERHREIGLLRALGTRRRQVVSLFVAEAALTTGLGGLCGILLGGSLLLLFQRSLGYYFETVNVAFLWPSAPSIVLSGLGCTLAAALVGVLGGAVPAARTGRLEPYALIQAGGK